MVNDYKLVFCSILNSADSPIAQFELKENGKCTRTELSTVGLALSIEDKVYNFLNYSFTYVEDRTIVLINIIPDGHLELLDISFKWHLAGTLKIIDSQKTIRLEASGEHTPTQDLITDKL